jgi:hypothetical protein
MALTSIASCSIWRFICGRSKALTTSRLGYDAGIAGFGCRVTANGARSYILNYRTRSGRERRYTIGDATHWRCTDARAEAKRLKAVVDQGGDPQGELQDERTAPAMLDLCQRFEAEHLPRLRAFSRTYFPKVLKDRVLPFFGAKTKVADVTYGDIDRFHRAITAEGSPYAANRYLSMLSKMFSLAVRWEMCERNPCKGIERNYEAKRRRYLNGEELARLTAALAKARRPAGRRYHPDAAVDRCTTRRSVRHALGRSRLEHWRVDQAREHGQAKDRPHRTAVGTSAAVAEQDPRRAAPARRVRVSRPLRTRPPRDHQQELDAAVPRRRSR